MEDLLILLHIAKNYQKLLFWSRGNLDSANPVLMGTILKRKQVLTRDSHFPLLGAPLFLSSSLFNFVACREELTVFPFWKRGNLDIASNLALMGVVLMTRMWS